MPERPHTGFSDVDATGAAAQLGDYLRTVSATDYGRESKARSLAALGLHPGQRALDVGCGLGDEVRAMAAIVGPAGRAVGVDASAEFIAQAAEQAAREGSSAEFLVGDALALPFEDGAFDAVRTERTLQHVQEPAVAIAELVRVTAPGGVVAASEPDWETLVLDLEPPAASRRIQAALCATVRNPTVGRALRRHLRAAGLTDVVVQPSTILLTDAALAAQLLDLPEIAAAAGDDAFFAAATGFLVTGRKPG